MPRKSKLPQGFDANALAASASEIQEMPRGTRNVESTNPFLDVVLRSWNEGLDITDPDTGEVVGQEGKPFMTDPFPVGEWVTEKQKKNGEMTEVQVRENIRTIRNLLRGAASYLSQREGIEIGIKTRPIELENDYAQVAFQAMPKRGYNKKSENGATDTPTDWDGNDG